MTPRAFPHIVPFGEQAFLVELGEGIDVELNARVHALAAAIEAHVDAGSAAAGSGTPVPAYASVLVPFDPDRTTPAAVEDLLERLAHEAMAPGAAGAQPGPATARTVVEIGVRYGGEDGPDLAQVSVRTGLTEAQVIELHAGTSYHVFMLGFAPGFAYLGPLPDALRLPRLPEPRLRVPKGSVAIAAAQTAVYPHATPGGWHLIGRTSEILWDRAAPEPARLRPGDRVRFVPA